MEKVRTAIIGGGAAGLFAAASLPNGCGKIILFERGDRLGRKLSATGNGQGNISNEEISLARYFCVGDRSDATIGKALKRYGVESIKEFFENLGVLLQTDERGRVYPSSRQASSLTDALRREVSSRGVDVRLNARVTSLKKKGDVFLIGYDSADGEKTIAAETVLLCTGGKAAKNFGTDGSAFALAQGLGHGVTALYPSLVQLKTDTAFIKTLKGIRVNDALVRAYIGEEEACALTGDIIFTDYGVSGDAIFRVSAFVSERLLEGARLSIDFLPTVSEERLFSFLLNKRKNVKSCPEEELLCGIVNNQIARAIAKRAGTGLKDLVAVTKDFTLKVTGSLGFDYAQVTKGGVPLSEVNERFESKKVKGLYFAGETLDIDGECGGFNLHFAYASARTVAQAIGKNSLEKSKGRGQV
ncbi:MAG: aminoacetone oxidase family FAD-binding enzyme [Clostridia bacterium]|nr:aminoacetone oxidase family FAD-binding enzyme [Clostridia bacterium]